MIVVVCKPGNFAEILKSFSFSQILLCIGLLSPVSSPLSIPLAYRKPKNLHSMVTHTCNPRTKEAETGRLEVGG